GYESGDPEFVEDDNGGYWKVVNYFKKTRIVKVWEGLPDGVTPPDPIFADLLDSNGNIIRSVPLYYDPATGTSVGYGYGTFFGVGESQVPGGYVLGSIEFVKDDEGGYWKIVNIYNEDDKETEIVKLWVGLPDGVTPPDPIYVDIIDANGTVIATIPLHFDSTTRTSRGYYTGTFASVDESQVPAGYSLESIFYVENDDGTGYWKVVNKYTGAEHEHTENKPVIENAVDATCTANGSHDEVIYCSICGIELGRITVIDYATGHVPGPTVIENQIPATFTVTGRYDKVVYCTVCGAELSRQTVTIPRTAFRDADIGDEVVRGERMTWKITTSTETDWIKLSGAYTTGSGTPKNIDVYYKASNYLNSSGDVTVVDSDGLRTWTIPMTFNYASKDDSVVQTWSVFTKTAGSALWVDSGFSKDITVAKTQAILSPVSETYAPYSIVSAECDADEIANGGRGIITVVTTSDCNKVRVTYTDASTGKKKATTYQTTSKNNVTFTDNPETGLREWKINFKFSAPADGNEYLIDTRGDTWSNQLSVYVTVN
ncbi:MAG: hypothetical protein IKH65_09000, partial [Clostridia bacterium]|nr:hypothetical protein [Clostridia bacterium]